MTITEVKELNARNGNYWFSPGTMRFFNSRICKRVEVKGNKAYFVSSERYIGCDRLCTLRACNLDMGNILTIGEYMAYPTRALAMKELDKIKEQS